VKPPSASPIAISPHESSVIGSRSVASLEISKSASATTTMSPTG
jgi:hypothetical protein